VPEELFKYFSKDIALLSLQKVAKKTNLIGLLFLVDLTCPDLFFLNKP
jgi:hypothetical protein